jgi:hypothetical protein
MSIPVLPSFNSKEYSFPSRDISPDKKKSEYCASWAKAIYSLFCRNRTSFTLGEQEEFATLRLYARGEQDITQYQKWLLGDTTSNPNGATSSFDDLAISRVSKREGWGNILWQNISPAPQIMSAIHGMFDKADFDLYVDTIDADSRKLAEEIKFTKFIEAQNIEWQNKIKMDMGIPIDEEMVYPKSKEELDMFEAQDGFKLNVARAMQKILRHTFNISEWDTVVFKKVLDDLITIEYGATEDYYDQEDSKWKARYLDPAKLVIQYSNEHDYSDSEYAGYYESHVTISHLRSKLPDVTEKELMQLAQKCMNSYGNPGGVWDVERYSKLDPNTGVYPYDGFKVPVFHAWWIDTNVNKKLYYKSFRGRESIINLSFDSDVKPLTEANKKAGASQEIRRVVKRQPYEAYWVIDTDYVYDFGPINMAARERLSKPQLPVHVEQLLQPSLIKRIKPILDQITQTFLRHQNSMAINVPMLANVSLGGGKLTPAEVIKLGRNTGAWLYSYSAGTGMYAGGAATPITPIKGGMGERVVETAATLDFLFKELERETGINPVSLGASPDPNAPVGTTQAALQATTNVLKPLMDACYEIKKGTGECLMRRIQVGIKNSDKIREAYVGVISPSDMEALRLMEADGVQYGLSLKAKPDMKQKMRFENWINIALQNTREQRPGIDLNDAVWFMSQLENGADLLDLEKQLEYAIEKNKQEAQAQSQKAMETQGQINAQNEQVKIQGQQALLQAEGGMKINEEIVRGKVKANQTKLEGNLALLEAARQSMEAEQGLVVNTGGK